MWVEILKSHSEILWPNKALHENVYGPLSRCIQDTSGRARSVLKVECRGFKTNLGQLVLS